jgi:hypothetical protein
MKSPASNVRVFSNIYPVKTVTTVRLPGRPEYTSGVIEDAKFRGQIWCKSALRKLSDFKAGGVVDDRCRREILIDRQLVDAAQIDACWDPDCCVDCLPGDRPFGPVTKGNQTTIECRCTNPNCPGRQQAQP